LLACRTRTTVLDTYNVTTFSTLCPQSATIYALPLGETGTVPPLPSKPTLLAGNFASETYPASNKALCPSFSKNQAPFRRTFATSICGCFLPQ
jgi:hypothetical protein